MTSRRARSIAAGCLLTVTVVVTLLFLAFLAATCTWGRSNDEFPDPDVDSGRLLRLTHNDSTERNPSWSPRGDKIAFECITYDRGGIWPFARYASPVGEGEVRNWTITTYYYPSNICVMNADGSGRTQLTDDDTEDYDPTWSPDGSKIAFSQDRAIHVMNADGSELRRITDNFYSNRTPAWSPDGTRIAYASWRDASFKIVVIDADGSNPTQITDRRGSHLPRGSQSHPTWSPDGNRIAFLRATDDSADIYVMNADGTEQTLLLDASELYKEHWRQDEPAYVQSPAWSPDGTRIAFVFEVEDPSPSPVYNIFSVNVDRPGVDRLTCRRHSDLDPTWSPNGSKLAFTSSFHNLPEVYILVAIERCHRKTDPDYAHMHGRQTAQLLHPLPILQLR